METWIIGHDTVEDVITYINNWRKSCIHPPVLCFDFFDTLVVRCVEPEHTKIIAACLQEKILKTGLSREKLYSIRQRIETDLCEKNIAANGEPEFAFVEFCSYFLRELQRRDVDEISSWKEHNFTDMLLNLEIAVELGVQEICDATIQVLRSARENEIKTALVSDFYLPAVYFHKMLREHRLDDLFDHVFISSDYGLMKGTGRMYKGICEELGCSPDQLLMIGDNPHADVAMAREYGCNAIHVQNLSQQQFYQKFANTPDDYSFSIVYKFEDALEQQSVYSEIGYSIWYFSYLLFEELNAKQIKDVFFFSKEGEFLKKIFDRFQIEVFGYLVVKSHYVFVSRKATFIASLRSLEQEDFLRLFDHYRDISLREFLLSLNFSENFSQSLCEKLGLDYFARRLDLRSHQDFQTLLGSDTFNIAYEEHRIQQKRNFIHYLDSFGVDYIQKGLTIVDVGWKGSIQDNVFHILNAEVDIHGYFMGSLIATELKDNNRKTGLLFSDRPEPSPFFNVYNNNRSLFEMVLGATHGSADGYYTDQEYKSDSGGIGQIVQLTISNGQDDINVMTLDLPEERKLYQDVVQPIQEKFLKLAGRLNKAYLAADCTIPDSEWFARQHARVVFKPTSSEIQLFERLYHLENFGIFEFTDFKSGNTPSLKQRLLNLKNVLHNSEILESGIWPPIILRRLGIGFFQYFDGMRRHKREFSRK